MFLINILGTSVNNDICMYKKKLMTLLISNMHHVALIMAWTHVYNNQIGITIKWTSICTLMTVFIRK